MDKNYDVITLFQNTFHVITSFSEYLSFKRPGVAIFTGTIKIVTVFIKIIFKDSRKVKIIRNYISKCSLDLYLLI